MRTRTLLLLAATFTVAVVGAASLVAGTAPDVAAGGAPSSNARRADVHHVTNVAMRASAVLRAWDHRRAAAWSRADVGALSRLYTVGSRAGRSDVVDLRRWRSRGLRVVGLRQQVIELRVRVRTPRRVALTVTDRTVDGVAVGHHRRTALPASAWARHRIRLRRAHGHWLVEEVVAQPAR